MSNCVDITDKTCLQCDYKEIGKDNFKNERRHVDRLQIRRSLRTVAREFTISKFNMESIWLKI